jgi:hypothetical protein
MTTSILVSGPTTGSARLFIDIHLPSPRDQGLIIEMLVEIEECSGYRNRCGHSVGPCLELLSQVLIAVHGLQDCETGG